MKIFIKFALVIFLFQSCSSNSSHKIEEISTKKDSLANEIVLSEEIIKDFSFIGEDLCAIKDLNKEQHLIHPDTLNKYRKHNPYHVKEFSSTDSLHIIFEAISDCCLTPIDNIEVKNDSVIIKPGYGGESPCDCYCDYLFRYSFPKNNYDSLTIVVSEIKH